MNKEAGGLYEKTFVCPNCKKQTIQYQKETLCWCCHSCGEFDKKRNEAESAKSKGVVRGFVDTDFTLKG